MAASIAFDDGSGSQTLTSLSGRFNGWQPLDGDVGERATAYGDGVRYQWAGRSDFIVAFSFPIAQDQMAVAAAFRRWANAGGEFSIDTDDTLGNTYATCGVAEGSDVDISPRDPVTLDYTVTVPAVNLALSPSTMVCLYD